MKKVIAIMMAVLLMVPLTACGSSANKGIELNAENILDYLNISVSYDNERSSSWSSYYMDADMTIDIYPVRGGSFENTKLILIIFMKSDGMFNPTDPWIVSETDDSYKYIAESPYVQGLGEDSNDYYRYLITEITLPADGEYTETHAITGNCLTDLPLDRTLDEIGLGEDSVNDHFSSPYLAEGTALVTGTFVEQ